ncbi:MAG: hypothetical protein ACOY3K_05140 [Candidatus Omnitrophota bacterium]
MVLLRQTERFLVPQKIRVEQNVQTPQGHPRAVSIQKFPPRRM